MPDGGFLLLAADDLLVSSRIETTARHLGYAVRVAHQPGEFWEAAGEGPVLVLIATSATRLPWEALVHELRKRPSPPPVLAFGSHLDGAMRDRARSAGVTRWVANSQVAASLPSLIETLVQNRSA